MKRKNLLLVLAVFGFALMFKANFSEASGPTIINSGYLTTPTVWTKENSPYIVNSYVSMSSSGSLTIESGVIVKIGSKGSVYGSNNFYAKGTEDEKIVFTSWKDDSFGGDTNNDGDSTKPAPGDWDSIVFGSSTQSAVVENAVILYGGSSGTAGLITIASNDNTSIKNNEIKYGKFAGLLLRDSLPVVENNLISNNNTGVVGSNKSTNKIPVMRNNSIENNSTGAFTSGKIDARENWWGDKTGPLYDTKINDVEKNLGGKGNKVGDGVIFSPWLGDGLTKKREPIILVPGIGATVNLDLMVSGVLNDNWTLFDHTYDGIIQAFKKMGYEENKDLFICYYDWRKSNADSAKDFLKPLIAKANSINGTSKVNVVAHSMGGLVARSYVQGNSYSFDVDNLILIATPNKGSSDIYPVWEGGYIPKNWENRAMMNMYLAYMDAKNGTFNNYETIHNYIPSVKELMPVYDFIYPKDYPDTKVGYLQMKEKNNFLINLNQSLAFINSKVALGVISGNSQETVNGIPTISSDNNLWTDGKPDPIDPEKNDSNGDGEVLLSSSQIQGLSQSVLNYDHRNIVSQSEKIIASKIEDNLDTIYPAPDVNNELGFWVASPVYIEIRDVEGRVISKDENTMPLAKYASESKPDGVKFVSIPNPIKGEYKIKLTGNGNGEYHVGSEFSDYTGKNENVSSVSQGEINKDQEVEYKITYNPENIENSVDEIKPSDTTPPTITGKATTEPNENGWYNSDVTIHFEASDSESGIDTTTPDITLTTEGGNQSVTGAAKDKVGNEANYVVSGINIDKTVPRTELQSSVTKGNGDWYVDDVKIMLDASDQLSEPAETYYSLNDASYEKGNVINILSEGIHVLKYYSTDKAGNKEEIKTETIKIDKTAPEVKIIFNQTDQKLDIIGIDNLSQNVSVTTEEKEIELKPETKKNAFSWIFNIIKKEKGKKINIVTLSDEAGHKTEVTFEKKQDNGHFISISLQSILYDRAKTEFSKSLLQYKWFLDWKRSKYVLFGSHIVNDDNLLESHYVSKNNETWIMSKPQELDDDNNDDDVERRPAWKKVPGMVIPYLQTEQGELKMEY